MTCFELQPPYFCKEAERHKEKLEEKYRNKHVVGNKNEENCKGKIDLLINN